MERLADGRNHQSNVVAEFAIAEFCHSLHDAPLGLGRGTAGRPRYLYDTLGAKLDSLLVFGFRAPVGEEQQAITGNQLFRRARVVPLGTTARHAARATK